MPSSVSNVLELISTMMKTASLLTATVGILIACVTQSARAWDYEGHRSVNQLALAALPTNFPAFALTPEARERIAFLSGEADRWRNYTNDLSLSHCSGFKYCECTTWQPINKPCSCFLQVHSREMVRTLGVKPTACKCP